MPNGKNPNGDPEPIPPMLNAELKIPETIVNEYRAAKNKAGRLDKGRLGIEVLTLVAIIIYACISYRQWIATEEAANAAKQSADAATSVANTSKQATAASIEASSVVSLKCLDL